MTVGFDKQIKQTHKQKSQNSKQTRKTKEKNKIMCISANRGLNLLICQLP